MEPMLMNKKEASLTWEICEDCTRNVAQVLMYKDQHVGGVLSRNVTICGP